MGILSLNILIDVTLLDRHGVKITGNLTIWQLVRVNSKENIEASHYRALYQYGGNVFI